MKQELQLDRETPHAHAPPTAVSATRPFAHPMLQLQRQLGNQAVQQVATRSLFQAKLVVGRPGDPYEQEADRVADLVTSVGQATLQRKSPCEGCTDGPQQCEQCRKKREEETSPAPAVLQRTPASGADTGTPHPAVRNTLRSSGYPLDGGARGLMENRFGRDFSSVRVHTDAAASRSADAVHALAYTVGNDVVFAAGQYDPQTEAGQKLLAHELTHTIQQGGNGVALQKATPGASDTDVIEVGLISSLDQYTPPGSNVVYRVGENASTNILMDIVSEPDNTVTFKWYAFEYGRPMTGSWYTWDFLKGAAIIGGDSPGFRALGAKLSPSEWRALWPNPVPALFKKFEKGEVDIPPEAFLSAYRGMIRETARTVLDDNEQQIDALLKAPDKVEKIKDYSAGLKEASVVRDQLETRQAELQKSLDVGQQQFTFGLPKMFVNTDPYRRIRLFQEKAPIDESLVGWYAAFPLLTRLRTPEITPERVEQTLQTIKSNIIAAREDLGSGKLDPWELANVRGKLDVGIGAKGQQIIAAEEKSKKHWGWFKTIAFIAGGIALLFIPGGIFIDAAIGLAVAADAWDEAVTVGHAANTALSVDDGLMTQAQANMAKWAAIFSTVAAVMGAAAAGLRALKVGRAFIRLSGAIPELETAEKMTLARSLANHPELVRTLAGAGADEAVVTRLRAALRQFGDDPKALTKALESVGEFTKLRRAEAEVLKDVVENVPIEGGKHALRIDKTGRMWLCSELCTDVTELATKVLGGHRKILENADAVRLVQNLVDNGMEAEVVQQVVKAAGAGRAGIKNALLSLARLQALDRAGIKGTAVVIADLAQGGNKAVGARFVLRYLEENDLWSKVQSLEAFEALESGGARRYDAVIDGVRYQFKNWGEFNGSTFVQQMRNDLELTSLEKLQWVFSNRLGSKAGVMRLAREALLDAARRDPAFAADARRIISGLKDVIKVY